jgi:hypothetical protein
MMAPVLRFGKMSFSVMLALYSHFQVNEPHFFFITQRRKDAKEEVVLSFLGIGAIG